MRPFRRLVKFIPTQLEGKHPIARPKHHIDDRRAVRRYQRMRSLGVPRYRYLMMVPVLLLAIVLTAWIKMPPLDTVRYRPVRHALNNPLTGWAVDASIEPGTAEFSHTLVHATLTWREFEPVEGEYDFDSFERNNHFAKWRELGYRVILRFVLDEPSADASADLPEWLMAQMGDDWGTYYESAYGYGFSPDYADDFLQMKHGQAISALGAKYNNDPFVAFVELGSLGHNGEWWVDTEAGVPVLPLWTQIRNYIAAYSFAFTDTAMLATNPYQPVKLLQAGLYNPFLGDADETWNWVDMATYGGYEDQIGTDLKGMGEFFKTAPSGGQLAHGAQSEMLMTSNPERLIDQVRECHTTYISNVAATGNSEQTLSNMRIIQETMGYRFWVRSAQWQKLIKRGENMPLTLYIRNSGVAPMSQSWDVVICILKDDREVFSSVSSIDTHGIQPGETVFNENIDVPIELEPGEYELGLYVRDPATGEPAVELAMVTKRQGLISVLGGFEIE